MKPYGMLCLFLQTHDIDDDTSLMTIIYLSHVNALIQMHDNAIMIAWLILDQIAYLLNTKLW